jgi:hypothetical protein
MHSFDLVRLERFIFKLELLCVRDWSATSPCEYYLVVIQWLCMVYLYCSTMLFTPNDNLCIV